MQTPLDRIPVFVKGGTLLLPLAHPTLHTSDANSFELTVRGMGRVISHASCTKTMGRYGRISRRSGCNGKRVKAQGALQRPEMGRPGMYTVARWDRVPKSRSFPIKSERWC